MRDLPGFDAFAADHVRPLARTALALTGDPEAARALVVTALSAVAARWVTTRWSFPADATRKALYAAYLERPRPRGAAGGRGPHPSLTPGSDAAALAEALTALPPRRRALVVACFHDGHTTWQAAGLCRMDARTANTETVLAVAEMRDRLPAFFVAGTAPETTAGTAPDTGVGTAPGSKPAGLAPSSWSSPSRRPGHRPAPGHHHPSQPVPRPAPGRRHPCRPVPGPARGRRRRRRAGLPGRRPPRPSRPRPPRPARPARSAPRRGTRRRTMPHRSSRLRRSRRSLLREARARATTATVRGRRRCAGSWPPFHRRCPRSTRPRSPRRRRGPGGCTSPGVAPWSRP